MLYETGRTVCAGGIVIHRPLNRLVCLNDANSVGKPRRRVYTRRLLLHLSGVFIEEVATNCAIKPVAVY